MATQVTPPATPIFKLSLPTRKQALDILEYAVVGFIGTFVAVWVKQPNPFSKASALVALGTAAAGVLAIVKGLVTTL